MVSELREICVIGSVQRPVRFILGEVRVGSSVFLNDYLPLRDTTCTQGSVPLIVIAKVHALRVLFVVDDEMVVMMMMTLMMLIMNAVIVIL